MGNNQGNPEADITWAPPKVHGGAVIMNDPHFGWDEGRVPRSNFPFIVHKYLSAEI